MDVRETADVSRFMLFEATGDSEADCDAIVDEEVGYQIAGAHCDDDDDDAQSCSCDGSEYQNCNLGDQRQQLNGYESCVSDADNGLGGGKKNDDEEEAGVYGTSYCDDDELEKHEHRSSLSVDPGQQLMDEMEKNRRFWEACLAS